MHNTNALHHIYIPTSFLPVKVTILVWKELFHVLYGYVNNSNFCTHFLANIHSLICISITLVTYILYIWVKKYHFPFYSANFSHILYLKLYCPFGRLEKIKNHWKREYDYIIVTINIFIQKRGTTRLPVYLFVRRFYCTQNCVVNI